jgi:hypothetical protein
VVSSFLSKRSQSRVNRRPAIRIVPPLRTTPVVVKKEDPDGLAEISCDGVRRPADLKAVGRRGLVESMGTGMTPRSSVAPCATQTRKRAFPGATRRWSGRTGDRSA